MTRHLALCRALPARPITAALLALTLALGHVGLGDPGTDACGGRIGSVQAIVRDASSGAWVGAADPRREGTVIRVPATAGQNRLSCPPATGGRNRSHASGGSS